MARIAMIVSNPCNPDYRVIKEAESLVRHGHEVRIFCTARKGVPDEETVNGVSYQRIPLRFELKILRRSNLKSPNAAPAVVLAAPARAIEAADRATSAAASATTSADAAVPAAAAVSPDREAAGKPAALPRPEGLAGKLIDHARHPVRAVHLTTDFAGRKLRRVRRSVGRAARHGLSLPGRAAARLIGVAAPVGAAAGRGGQSLAATAVRTVLHPLKSGPVVKRAKFGILARTFAPSIIAFDPDVVHAHDLICLPCGRQVAKAVGARLVYDSHELETHRNPPLPYFLKRHYRAVEARNIRHADAVITVCEPIADHLKAEYRIARPFVVYNAPPVQVGEDGVAPPQGWKANVQENRDIRREAGVPADGILGIYVGLVTINRGIETMIDVLPRLPNVWFAAVGPRNEAFARTLVERAESLGVADRFSILPAVHPDSVVEFISGADFGINPLKPVTLSYNYAMPNKIFEMSLAGLAIVNSDAQETARYVSENGIGVVFRHADPDDCIHAIEKLALDIGRYRPDADGLKSLRDRYGWHRQEETLIRLYDDVLARRPGRRPLAGRRPRLAPA
ncbi:MAG: glycosyltransferase [Hyphomicrobiaceae bacterium]